MAEGMAGAIAPNLERVAEAEARATQSYRNSVEAQREADAIPIPKLSGRAEEAVATLAAARDDKTCAALWRRVTADPALGPELQRFSKAVLQRFGAETVRTMLRSPGGSAEAPSVAREHQPLLASVSRTMHTLNQGEFADSHERLAHRRELGRGWGISR